MKLRESLQYVLGMIPLVMLGSLVLGFVLSGTEPKPPVNSEGYPDPWILSGQDVSEEELLRAASSGARIVAEPGDIGADGDARPDPDVALLFGLQSAQWNVLYVRAGEAGEYIGNANTPDLAAILSGRDARFASLPCLVFTNADGRSLVLEPLRDFDGKTPIVRLNSTYAALNTRVAINVPAYDNGNGLASTGLGSIDLGLTEEGKRKLAEAGIPEFIPAAIERHTPRSSTLLLNATLSEAAQRTEMPVDPVTGWYRSTFARYFPGSRDEAYWRVFAPLIRAETSAARERHASRPVVTPVAEYRFRVDTKGMWRTSDGKSWEPFTIKGVNLGSSLPGRAFTEFSRDEGLYWHWFTLMRDMNLNAVRIYTLFPPEFYRALAAFNRNNPGRELFLLQEIWPDESPPNNNLLDENYNARFHREIEYTVAAVHGEARVPERRGRASGVYDADVSPWTAAFLVGREIESEEVLATDSLNAGYRYEGRWFSVPKGSPTESWLAAACDGTATFEIDRWGETRPVSIVSWPPLDPIPHWVEWRDPWLDGRAPKNDRAEVVIDRIDVRPEFEAGFFSSWHIYPNYPDFMIATPWYSKYRDDDGEFRYGGYLRELRLFSSRYPMLLAEFGLSTSLGTAYFAPDGLDHGGIPEGKQGKGLIRMAKAALAEGWMGTVFFEWADEWAKQTWTTAPMMIPLSGHQSWRNALDPEQHYGVLAMDAHPVGDAGSERMVQAGGSVVSLLDAEGNEEFLTLRLARETDWEGVTGTIQVGFDVLDPSSGIRTLTDRVPESDLGFEFLLEIDLPLPKEGAVAARLLAADTCNPGLNSFAMTGARPKAFTEVHVLVNRETVDSEGIRSGTIRTNRSALYSGSRGVRIDRGVLTVAVPWAMLNVADPSRALVIDDPRSYDTWPEPDTLRVTEGSVITMQGAFIGIADGKASEDWFPRKESKYARTWAYAFKKWDHPRWRERMKEAGSELTAFFGSY